MLHVVDTLIDREGSHSETSAAGGLSVGLSVGLPVGLTQEGASSQTPAGMCKTASSTPCLRKVLGLTLMTTLNKF